MSEMALAPTANQGSAEARELTVAAQQASVVQEIQGAIMVAQRFPRDEAGAMAKLVKSCERPSFAESAAYAFPRGGQTVKGPSVNLAREAARLWGNIRYGVHIVNETPLQRTVRAWAWDMETNNKVEQDDTFEKLIYRKKGGWQKPDERDLRELTNRRAAIAIRNCLLQLLPKDMVEDAMRQADETIEKGIKDDPQAHKKKLVQSFLGLGVEPEQLAKFLKHSVDKCSPKEIAELRQIYVSIRDGNSSWSDHLPPEEKGSRSDAVAQNLSGGAKPEVKAGGSEKSAPSTLTPPNALARILELRALKQIDEPTFNGVLREEFGKGKIEELTAPEAAAMVKVLEGM